LTTAVHTDKNGAAAVDYTLTTVTRLVQPYDLKVMNDDFQEAQTCPSDPV